MSWVPEASPRGTEADRRGRARARASHQEGAEHVEADEVVVGEAGAARVLLPRGVVGPGLTPLAVAAGQEDLLPCLTCRAPGRGAILPARPLASPLRRPAAWQVQGVDRWADGGCPLQPPAPPPQEAVQTPRFTKELSVRRASVSPLCCSSPAPYAALRAGAKLKKRGLLAAGAQSTHDSSHWWGTAREKAVLSELRRGHRPLRPHGSRGGTTSGLCLLLQQDEIRGTGHSPLRTGYVIFGAQCKMGPLVKTDLKNGWHWLCNGEHS